MRKKIKRKGKGKAPAESTQLRVYDIPVGDLISSSENPNEMLDTTFDELVEGMRRDGFDEPILVMPVYDDDGEASGKYIIASGHHRKKAAELIGMKSIPAIIKEGWDDDARKLALVRRNLLHGKVNPAKFTALYDDLATRHDKEVLKLQMGFHEKKSFEAVYRDIAKQLPSKQRSKLAAAKEHIKSVDDLSSVLNTIFKEHGSDLDSGFLVFSFGGKNHHYIEISSETDKLLKRLEKDIDDTDMTAQEVFGQMIASFNLNSIEKSDKKRPLRKRRRIS